MLNMIHVSCVPVHFKNHTQPHYRYLSKKGTRLYLIRLANSALRHVPDCKVKRFDLLSTLQAGTYHGQFECCSRILKKRYFLVQYGTLMQNCSKRRKRSCQTLRVLGRQEIFSYIDKTTNTRTLTLPERPIIGLSTDDLFRKNPTSVTYSDSWEPQKWLRRP